MYEREFTRQKVVLAAFFAENNLALSLVDKLIPLMIKICDCNDYSITALKNQRLKRTSFTNLILKLDKVHTAELTEKLKKQSFSILYHESTGISTDKFGTVIVRFYDEIVNKVVSFLWQLIPI